MILEIKKWCEGIIVAVILCIIIECLIPNGNNKKYIKVVIGIYIMYVILNPILNLFEYEIDLQNIFKTENNFEEVSNNLDNQIKDVYILGIEENIKSEITNLGYEVSNIKIFVDISYQNIEKIELQIKNKKNTNTILVEPIEINDKKINDADYAQIKKFISENYFVKEENILFK
ncbi:MAG: stage III sporulation protein AF [Clostridia bacterium]|nr:stage III sporulation protein AF [Clostridia bacterium]